MLKIIVLRDDCKNVKYLNDKLLYLHSADIFFTSGQLIKLMAVFCNCLCWNNIILPLVIYLAHTYYIKLESRSKLLGDMKLIAFFDYS